MNRLQKGGTALAASAVLLVSGFEGVSTIAYRDPVGIPTICFGETRGVYIGEKETLAECQAGLKNGLLQFSTGLDKCLHAKVSDLTYEALLSWTWNVGVGAACSSTLVKKANAGDMRGACDQLLVWDRATKLGVSIVLPGLLTRRQKERSVCLEGLA